MKIVFLEEEDNTKVLLFLLKNIKDTSTLRTKIIKGEIDCCAVKPALVISPFQLVIAADKAARNKRTGKLKTKSLNTELLYNLSISRNISQSLNKFGIDNKDRHTAIVIFEEKGESKFEQIKSNFEGEICDIEEIIELSDIDLIKKTYKIPEKELEFSELIDSVVSRIATRDFGFC